MYLYNNNFFKWQDQPVDNENIRGNKNNIKTI